MTGWRLGWLVVPDHLDKQVDALNQNMNVSAPTLSQRAAVAAALTPPLPQGARTSRMQAQKAKQDPCGRRVRVTSTM